MGKTERRVTQFYSSILSLTSALDGMGGQRQAPAALPPTNSPGTLCTGGWLDPMGDLNGCGKSRRDRVSGAEYFRS